MGQSYEEEEEKEEDFKNSHFRFFEISNLYISN